MNGSGVGVMNRFVMAATALAVLSALVLVGGCGALFRTNTSSTPNSTGSAGVGSEPKAAGDDNAVLYLGVMVHVEGWKDEANLPAAFDEHSGALKQYAGIFEKYGGKLTIEASPEFIEACGKYENVLKELYDRGHGIGVHADLGGEPGLTQEAFAGGLARMKAMVEALGMPVRHVSGVCSSLDWVRATADAGFRFVTGAVEYALKSIPPGELPAEYRGVLAARTPGDAHGTVPYELADRLHPWRMESGANWLDDSAAGSVVLMPGDSGTNITAMSETADGRSKVRRPPFDQADIDAFVSELEQAIALSEPGKVNVFYIGWSIGQKVDAAMVEKWAQVISPYVDSGKVRWKTIPEMYDAYLAWESAER